MRPPTGARLKLKAQVNPKVGADTVFVPYSFSGWWQGVDLLPYYPEGSAPFVRAEAINTGTTYGYDRVTMMQATKTTLCQVERTENANRESRHGANEIPARRRALHRVRTQRRGTQERERCAHGREPPP